MNKLKTSGFAIASLVFGVVGLFIPLINILAIIFGIIALVKIKKEPLLKGEGLAIAGIILGAIGIFTSLFFSFLLLGLMSLLAQKMLLSAQPDLALNLTALEVQREVLNDCESKGGVCDYSGIDECKEEEGVPLQFLKCEDETKICCKIIG